MEYSIVLLAHIAIERELKYQVMCITSKAVKSVQDKEENHPNEITTVVAATMKSFAKKALQDFKEIDQELLNYAGDHFQEAENIEEKTPTPSMF